MQKLLNYVAGELHPPMNSKWLDNHNPATGEVYSRIPDSDEADVQKAVEAAEAARLQWAATSPEERAVYLRRIADLIENRIDEFARAESIDNGKTIWLAREVDIPRAISNFRFFANAVTQTTEEAHQTSQTIFNYTHYSPVGIAGCISPWNLPIYLFTWKIAPAIAAGCPVIAKPSEITPMTAFMLSEVCVEADLPPGVLNILHGLGGRVGSAIVEHPAIKAISFTGGTSTGRQIASVAAPMFKKLSLELGGKNPSIIFADCDFERMLRDTVRSSFANQGQICLCSSRILVERPIYDKFKSAFVDRVKRIKVGDPLAEDTRLGAVASESHKEKILSYIQLAQEEGGKILTGGHEILPDGRCRDGYFVAPTVIEGLDETCRTNQEEIFGPVVTIMPFDTEEEALRIANSTEYGLSATIWTQNLSRAHRVSHKVDSGIIWVNCWLVRDLRTSFGGMKNSGVGREGGFNALRFFSEPKNVCIKLT